MSKTNATASSKTVGDNRVDLARELYIAVINKQIGLVRELVMAGADRHFVDNDGKMPLHHAAENGSWHMVFAITDSKSVLMKDRYGKSPLHYAATTDNITIIRHLVERGAWIDISDRSGNTPLHYAVMSKADVSVIEYLAGCVDSSVLHMKNRRGKNVFDIAVELNAKVVLRALRKAEQAKLKGTEQRPTRQLRNGQKHKIKSAELE